VEKGVKVNEEQITIMNGFIQENRAVLDFTTGKPDGCDRNVTASVSHRTEQTATGASRRVDFGVT
jgi:hypothetical protein